MLDLIEAVGRGVVHLIATLFELAMDLGVVASESSRWRLWGLVWLGTIGGFVAWATTTGAWSWFLLLAVPGACAALGLWLEAVQRRRAAAAAARAWHTIPPPAVRDPDEGNVPRW